MMQRFLFGVLPTNAGDSAWRPIHYLGSKLRLVEQISGLLDELDPTHGRACDLFSGSGTVALALSRSRDVVAADIQEYSRVICTGLLSKIIDDDCDSYLAEILTKADKVYADLICCVEPLIELEATAMKSAFEQPNLLCDIVEHGSLVAGHARDASKKLILAKKESECEIANRRAAETLLATRYFGGLYFSYQQAFWIDCITNAVRETNWSCREVGLAAVVSTASSVVNSIGKQFAQPIRPRKKEGTVKKHLIRQMCRDRCIEIRSKFGEWLQKYFEIPRQRNHRIVKGDYRDVLDNHCEDVAVIYADPPYTRDHYSRFYHVLETLCLRDQPSISTRLLDGTGANSRGVYRQDRHQSPFCIKSQAAGAFDAMLRKASRQNIPMLISYSPFVRDGHPRMLTIDSIVDLASNYYSRVRIVPVNGVKHSKLNKSELALDSLEHGEVFILCD